MSLEYPWIRKVQELQKIPLLIRPNSLKIQEEEKEGGASERFYQAPLNISMFGISCMSCLFDDVS